MDALEAKLTFMQSLQDFVDEAAPSMDPAKRALLARELFRVADRWAELPEPQGSAFLQQAKMNILRRLGVHPSRVHIRITCHPFHTGFVPPEEIKAGAAVYFSRLRNAAGRVVSQQSGRKPPDIRTDILSIVAEGSGFIVHSFLEGQYLSKRNVKQAIARASRKGQIAISEVVPVIEDA